MNTDGHGWTERADSLYWDLELGTSLEFGVWDLVYSNRSHPDPAHEPSSNQPTPDPSQEGNWPAGVAPLLGGAGGGFRGALRAKFSGPSFPQERKENSAPGQSIRVHPCPSVVQRFVSIRVHLWLNSRVHLMALMRERMGRKIDTAMVPTNITRRTISAGSTIAKIAFTRRGTMSW